MKELKVFAVEIRGDESQIFNIAGPSIEAVLNLALKAKGDVISIIEWKPLLTIWVELSE